MTDQFEALYKEMHPFLHYCKRISIKQLRESDDETQRLCLTWLQAIAEGPYAKLRTLLRAVTPEQWELRLKITPAMDEVVQRRKLERELRLSWEATIPKCLVKLPKQQKNTNKPS